MSRRLAALAFLPLLATACDAGHSHRTATPRASGPPGVVRVALAHLRWPLDPALVDGRDEATVARALFAMPLRTDPATGALRPGLCQSWAEQGGGQTWRFRCRRARAVAAALRRGTRLTASPERWL